MAEQQKWYASQPDYENMGLSLQSHTEAFYGHLGRARELTKKAEDSGIRADSKENAGISDENAATREAAFGNMAEAKTVAAAGVKLAPTSQAVDVEAELAYAAAGDSERKAWHRIWCNHRPGQGVGQSAPGACPTAVCHRVFWRILSRTPVNAAA